MNNRVALHLAEILRTDGEEPYIHGGDGRLRQRLEQVCEPDDWMEINLLVHAMRAGIISELLLMRTEDPTEEQLEGLVNRFTQRLAIQPAMAEWVINAWAFALGLSAEDESSDADPQPEQASEEIQIVAEAIEEPPEQQTVFEAASTEIVEEEITESEEVTESTEIEVATIDEEPAVEEQPDPRDELCARPVVHAIIPAVPSPPASRPRPPAEESTRAGGYVALSIVLLLLLGVSLQFWPGEKRLSGFSESQDAVTVLEPIKPLEPHPHPGLPPVVTPVTPAERTLITDTGSVTMNLAPADNASTAVKLEEPEVVAEKPPAEKTSEPETVEPVVEPDKITETIAKTRVSNDKAIEPETSDKEPTTASVADNKEPEKTEITTIKPFPERLEPAVHRVTIPQGRRTALTKIEFNLCWSDGRKERVYPRWKVISGDGKITKVGFEPSGNGGETVLKGFSSHNDKVFECELTIIEEGNKESGQKPVVEAPAAASTEPAEKPVETGIIVCTSTPKGATIKVDGRPMQGRTDIRVTDVPSGNRRIELSLAGEKVSRRVEVPAGGEVKVHADFPKETPVVPVEATKAEVEKPAQSAPAQEKQVAGIIDIRGNNPYAEVFLNGAHRGTGDMTFENLQAGSFQIMIKRPGKTLTASLDVRDGSYNILEVTDERIRVR